MCYNIDNKLPLLMSSLLKVLNDTHWKVEQAKKALEKTDRKLQELKSGDIPLVEEKKARV